MYMDRQTITKDQECTWTDNFTGKECTGQTITKDHKCSGGKFQLADGHTDTVTFGLLELLLRS